MSGQKDVLVHLHGHTTFSFQDGFGTPMQVVDRLKELGHTACACTDHGNVFAHVPYQKAFRAAGLKPIFGCEFYVVENMEQRTREQTELGANAFPHVTVLARTQQGYRNLLKLSRQSWERGFYYKPRIDWGLLAELQEGLTILSGCPGGWPTRLILGKDAQEAYNWLQRWRHRFEDFYVELDPSPSMGESSTIATETLARISQELRIPAVVTADAHFPSPTDHRYQDLMLCVGIGRRLADTTRTFRLPEYQYYCSGQELLARCLEVAPNVPTEFFYDAICRTKEIADRCEVEIPKAKPIAFPDVPEGKTSNNVLLDWVRDGFLRRYSAGQMHIPHEQDPQLRAKEYWDRAVYELGVIQEKGFADYILAVADVCRWMKDQNVLVMLRGSAGGCLLLWLLGASETDPIRHGLSFERFYDHTRQDPPDVDIDFEKLQRGKAIEYIYQKYGRANCSQIAALSKLKAKAALQDVCFALNIPRSEFAPLAEALDSGDQDVDRQLHEVSDLKALAVLQRYPILGELVPKLIGQYRQASIHAAGVLVSSEPLENVVGVVLNVDRQPVASVDKKGAAELGLLKFDFLSVNGLDIIGTTVRRLGKTVDWLFSLPLDDPKAIELADKGFLAGIFQLDGASAARVSRQIGLNTFEDIVVASALCRPGPGEWVEVYKRNKSDWHNLVTYIGKFHPTAQRIIEPTKGILLFQEQVMALARELAGFDWPHVHDLRKGVQDKLGLDPQTGPAWRQEWCARFIESCVAKHVGLEEAMFWWESIQSHGGYSFNKAHCTTYGIVGYWMLYLKAHYPGAFYESYLMLEDDEITMKRLINEFRAMGGQVELLDPECSGKTFSSPREGVLVGGYQNIKGIGPAGAEKIWAAAPFDSWDDLYARGLSHTMGIRFQRARIGSSKPDIQRLLMLAAWFPIPCIGAYEEAIRDQYEMPRLIELPVHEPMSEDVMICGYVTVLKLEKEKIIFVLEDETRSIVVRVPARMLHEVGPKFRQIEVTDFIAVKGWWAGDVLFAKDYVLAKRKAPDEPIHKPAAQRIAERAKKRADKKRWPDPHPETID